MTGVSAPGEPAGDEPRSTIIAGGRIITPGGLVDADLIIEQGRIAAIDQGDHGPEGARIDVRGLVVAPGLIDLQINGAFGHDFTSDPASIWKVGSRLPEHGVTAFLPTIISSAPAAVAAAQQALAAGPPPGYRGAVPLGLHVEGPMLSPRQAGTHDPDRLRDPADTPVDDWSPERGVRMVTLAPELPGALELIEVLDRRGVVVSLGHSDATYSQAVTALRRGARCGTHLYNAMSPFTHRRPGLVGALLTDPAVTVGIIADGIHVDPAAVRLAWQALGPNRLVLVTDAMAAMGQGRGTFTLGGVEVTVAERGPRNPAGKLAGSVLTLDEAVRNLIAFTGCTREEAIVAAATNPARLLGDTARGRTDAGGRADLALIGDDGKVMATLVAGEVVFTGAGVELPVEEVPGGAVG